MKMMEVIMKKILMILAIVAVATTGLQAGKHGRHKGRARYLAKFKVMHSKKKAAFAKKRPCVNGRRNRVALRARYNVAARIQARKNHGVTQARRHGAHKARFNRKASGARRHGKFGHNKGKSTFARGKGRCHGYCRKNFSNKRRMKRK
jgi:hypothetical protein